MTGASRLPEKQVALGVRCHSGWAAFVVLGAPAKEPRLLERGRMMLCDPGIEGSKQPFHTAESLPIEEASSFVDSCRNQTARLARRGLSEIARRHGRLSRCCVLMAGGRSLPGLAGILASHALIHAAEGAFYRDAILDVAEDSGIPVQRIGERELDQWSDNLLPDAGARAARLESFRKQVGSPWTQDEKRAALAAWLALAPQAPLRKRARLAAP